MIPPFIGLQRRQRETSLDKFNHYGGTKMKSLKIALVALMLTGFFGTQAKAQNNAVEGIIIGTAVGGIVGLIIASNIDTHNYGREHVYHKTVVYSPPPPPRYYRNHNHSKHGFKHVFKHGKKHQNIVIKKDSRRHYRQPIKVKYRDRR